MLKALIVEDEHHNQEVLRKLLGRYHSDVSIVGMAEDVEEAVLAIQNTKPDLIFLDIELKMKSAFDLLNRVDCSGIDIIFTTAFEQYALKAIKYAAIDYLLKPIDIDELSDALQTVRLKIMDKVDNYVQIQTLLANLKQPNTRLAIPTIEGFDFIPIEDILYCQADGSYSVFLTKEGKKIVSSKSLKYYENLVISEQLFRVSKSYIINLNYVKKFVKGKAPYIVMDNEVSISVSPYTKSALLELIKHQ